MNLRGKELITEEQGKVVSYFDRQVWVMSASVHCTHLSHDAFDFDHTRVQLGIGIKW